MRDLTRYEVLSNSKRVVRAVYALGDSLPSTERFGMRSQIERAAISIGANIAEGLGRPQLDDVERFLAYAAGSAAELSALLELAADLHDLSDPDLDDVLDHVGRQLTNLIPRVRSARRATGE